MFSTCKNISLHVIPFGVNIILLKTWDIVDDDWWNWNWLYKNKMLQEREEHTLTEWDRFAHHEYIRLSMEENGEDASNGSGEVWDEPLESPF